jgi:hypothetical protein
MQKAFVVYRGSSCWLVYGEPKLKELLANNRIESGQLLGLTTAESQFELEIGGQSSFTNYTHSPNVYH